MDMYRKDRNLTSNS